jgi:hypothetical protein
MKKKLQHYFFSCRSAVLLQGKSAGYSNAAWSNLAA